MRLMETQGHRTAALQHQASQLSRALTAEAERLSGEATTLESQRAKLVQERQESEAKLAEQRQELLAETAVELKKLDAQKHVMHEVHEAQASRITLNVGGSSFETSRATLQRWPGSFLEVMFSGRHALHPSKDDGSFFIDRDGACFAVILEYLRLGDKMAPQLDAREQEDKDRLWAEADYFGLPGLCDLLMGCGFARALTEDDVRMRAAEETQRLAISAAMRCQGGQGSQGSQGGKGGKGGKGDKGDKGGKGECMAGWTEAEPGHSPPPSTAGGEPFSGFWASALGKRTGGELASQKESMLRSQQAWSRVGWPGAAGRPGLVDGLLELFPAAVGLLREAARSNYTMLFEGYAQTLGNSNGATLADGNGNARASFEGDFEGCATPVGARPIVATQADFLQRFDARHRDVLSRLRGVHSTRSCGWFVAGGSVLGALLRRSTPAASDSDVDIFVFARAGSADERQRCASGLARRIFEALARDGEAWHVNRSQFVINLRRGQFYEGEPPVQIVLRLYDSPSEVLLGFDVDCCCVGYDGQHVWALPRALRALRHGFVVCNPLHSWPNQPTYELRLAKYAARGFAVAVPGLNLERVDVLRATTEAALPKLRGVARLLLLHAELQTRLKHSAHTGRPMPTLREMYGHVCLFSGYGPGAHDQARSLPTDEDESRLLNSHWMSSNVDPQDASPESTNGEGPPPHCNASLLVNPYVELEMDPFDLPPMNGNLREELWSVICDAGRDTLLIPRRLVWSTEPRSRESLNAKELNLDHSYFAPAYPPYGEEGERLARARNPFMSPRPLPSRAAGFDSEAAGPSTAGEPRNLKRGLFQDSAGTDFPAFADVEEALQAAATGTVVGGPEVLKGDALDL